LQVSGATPITIPLGRSQGELAAEIGATRSTLNRALKELERGRLIEMDGDTVVLLDPDALSRRVE
jgi:DNA-binding IclR family transcriptional regulator